MSFSHEDAVQQARDVVARAAASGSRNVDVDYLTDLLQAYDELQAPAPCDCTPELAYLKEEIDQLRQHMDERVDELRAEIDEVGRES